MKMKKQIVLAALPVILLSSLAYADFKLGDYNLDTSVELGGQMSSLDHTSGKFTEYKDIRHTNLISGVKISTEKDDYHLGFSASEIGYKDQSYHLNGGVYGKMKFSMNFDSIVHNNTFNAKTFFVGVGTGNLSTPITLSTTAATDTQVNYDPLISNTALWNPFDYSIKVKNYGLEGSYVTDSPFYLKWGVTQQKTDGVRPMGAADFINLDYNGGAGSAASYTNELPEPVDFKTNNFMLNGGYKGDNFLVAMDGTVSQFTNGIPTLTFQVPVVVSSIQTQTFALAPDNLTWKLGAQGTVFHLPLNSTLASRASFSKTSNNIALMNHATWGYTGANKPLYLDTAILPSVANFNGVNEHGTLNVALSSNPIENLDTKIYYNFLKNWNNSPGIFYTTIAADPTVRSYSVVGGRFANTKQNLGVDAGYKLPFSSRVSVGYDYLSNNRTGMSWINDPLTSNKLSNWYANAKAEQDNTGYIELKNSYFDFLSAKLRLQRMARKAQYLDPYAALGVASLGDQLATNGNYMYLFMHGLDQTSKTEDSAKVSLESSPIDELDLNLDGAVKKGVYPDNILGRVDDISYNTYLGASYNIPDLVRTSVFADYDVSYTRDGFRNVAGSGYKNYDPSAAPTLTNFNWNRHLSDKTFEFGINFDVPVNEKLDVSVGAQRQINDGKMAYSTQMPLPYPITDVAHYDDYARNTLTAKAKYKFTSNLTASIAYMFDQLKYDDFQIQNYTYAQQNSVVTNGTSFFTGANTDQNYTAHTVYLAAEYKF